jgi:dihydrofolate reductase
VVTSRAPRSHRLAESHDFTFVINGPAAALDQARTAAAERDVFVMGGGELIGSCLRDGLLDELRLHVSPEVLGAGTPLFAGVGRHRLTQISVQVSPVCTHLTYRVARR